MNPIFTNSMFRLLRIAPSLVFRVDLSQAIFTGDSGNMVEIFSNKKIWFYLLHAELISD